MANDICSNNNIFMTTNIGKLHFKSFLWGSFIEKYDLPYTFCYSLFKYLHLFAVKKNLGYISKLPCL